MHAYDPVKDAARNDNDLTHYGEVGDDLDTASAVWQQSLPHSDIAAPAAEAPFSSEQLVPPPAKFVPLDDNQLWKCAHEIVPQRNWPIKFDDTMNALFHYHLYQGYRFPEDYPDLKSVRRLKNRWNTPEVAGAETLWGRLASYFDQITKERNRASQERDTGSGSSATAFAAHSSEWPQAPNCNQ
ncbi:hypothetical protein [Rhizobium sp. NLR22b]|uniref:hypothetical protein n=1 Tax=Rhizobium sp. NLR22b TaxID=2731115 RepID=UPI001C839B47|nr:hypothetical protein [Rhizobium sp. NLR22b]MBX5242048.1 hypothetical protein [Rhizobium sp. NLR22b]